MENNSDLNIDDCGITAFFRTCTSIQYLYALGLLKLSRYHDLVKDLYSRCYT